MGLREEVSRQACFLGIPCLSALLARVLLLFFLQGKNHASDLEGSQ